MEKRIIINADDFGLTSGVNYGILHAYLNHSLSSISLMMNTSATKEAIEIMKKYQINCVGIHVNITVGTPVSAPKDIPSLVDEYGKFHDSSWWREHHDVNEDELILEFDHQIALFKALTNQNPNHINYHHRFDLYKFYPRLAKHLFTKYHLPMRLEKDLQDYPYEYAFNSIYFIDSSQPLKDYLIYDLIEMPCHVGFVDKEIMQISSLNLQRMEDSDLVNSKEFKDEYEKLGYKLVGWDQVQKKL